MASLRDIKKEIDYVVNEVVYDCYLSLGFHSDKQGEIIAVMQGAVDMRNDLNDLKRMMMEMRMGSAMPMQPMERKEVIGLLPGNNRPAIEDYAESEEVFDEPRELTKADVQREQIIRALRRHNGRRKEAAAELFMSERTLYRKIKELGIE